MPRADNRKFHYIYKTICTVTGRHYYGMHSTNNINDGYLGSGTILSRSVKKYGRESHIIEILEFVESREILRLREQELITEAALTDPMCMNLKLGGHGGFDHIKLSKDELAVRSKTGGKKQWELTKNDPQKLEQFKADKRAIVEEWRSNGLSIIFESGSEFQKNACALAQTKEAKAKRKKSFAKIDHQKGENNSQFGTCWIYSLVERQSIKIKAIELPSYLSIGWQAGRKLKF
jgi:hypothetical protein